MPVRVWPRAPKKYNMQLEKVLFIFKDRKSVTLNNDFWENKFKHKYNVNKFFINDNLNLTNNKIISKINQIINEEKINIVLLEGDHAHIIDYNFIDRLDNRAKKGIFLGDDMVWHQLNLISAHSCDFIFSSCPISTLKFQELGINSFFVPIECDGNFLKDYKLNKIYDVFHFGREKTNRHEYLEYLKKNNINIKSVSPYDEEANTFEKLSKLINQSKIVLNFTKSSNGNRNFNPLTIYKNFYQLKGRIRMAGISNVLCVTEFSPAIYLMYDKNELPSFKNKKECLNQIKYFLSNETELNHYTKRFHLKSLKYEDSRYIVEISNFLNQLPIKEKKYFSTPNWYKYIFINQTLRLRFKRLEVLAFFNEFFNNIFSLKYKKLNTNLFTFFCLIFIFLRYLPFLLFKFFFNLFKK